jgi:hypothetical protein
MAIPASGQVTLSDLQIEYGGTDPISINEYYRGGAYVPSGAGTATIPTSGAITLDNFRGTSKTATVTYNLLGGGGGGGYGADNKEPGRGSYAASGGSSTISAPGIQTITAAGGAGGENCGGGRGTSGTAGASSAFGTGGYGGSLNSAGGSATGYGAAGGGGGGDAGSTYDEGGASGFGGAAGTNLTGTVAIVYGTTVTIDLGIGGAGSVAGYYGGNGSPGRCQISWDGNTATFTSNGTVVIT